MSTPAANLQKTLCAMRWIAMLTGKSDVAKSIEQSQDHIKELV